MREDDDRRRGASGFQVAGEPSQLFGAEIAHAAGLEVVDIDETNEMRAAVVEGIPPLALRKLAVAGEIGRAVVLVDDIMFSRHVMHVEPGGADQLIRVVELVRLGEMGDVAGVNHEGGLVRQSADLADGLGQSGVRIGIGRLVEADVAVGNLDKGEARRGRFRRAHEP